MDNDVTGLPTALSSDPIVAGVTGEPCLLRAFGVEIGDTLKLHTSETHPWYQSHSPPAPCWATTAHMTTGTPETPNGEAALPGQQPGTRPWNPPAPRMTSVT